MKDKQEKILSEYSEAIKGKTKGLVSSTGKAKFANYSDEELAQLPDGTSEHSFGCGNPLAFSNVRSGQVVLDLGCGAGLDLLLAAKKVGHQGRVIGVEMNEDMLDKAKKNIEASGLKNIELRKGKIEELPIEPDSIDWVISNCVINLSSNKGKVFSEIARVLKPGGQILISDIVAENLPWWIKRSRLLTVACAGGAISEKEYLKGLNSAGMTECRIVARQYYEPIQMASVVVDALPEIISKLSCCGKNIASSLLTKVAKPISKNLWSAKFSGKMKGVI